MVDDVAQLERSNNKCYALAFRYIYKYRLEISHDILGVPEIMQYEKYLGLPSLVGKGKKVLTT